MRSTPALHKPAPSWPAISLMISLSDSESGKPVPKALQRRRYGALTALQHHPLLALEIGAGWGNPPLGWRL
jgi:hypothetical protein